MKIFRPVAWALLLAGLLAGCEMSVNMTDEDNSSSEHEPTEPTVGTNIIILATQPDAAALPE